jgi:L-amino acid N-acyltransferase YncA
VVIGWISLTPHSDRCVGFRDVGVHRRHGRLQGEWRDVVGVERLFGPAAAP